MPSLSELRAAVEAEFAASHPTEEPVAVVTSDNDEVEETPVAVVPEAPAPRTRYTRTIDLGDGSQPQVFKGATMDELLDKIVTAQTNASRTIKELKKKKQTITPEAAKPARKYEATKLTPDQEFALAQELQTNPSGAMAKLFKSVVGADPDEVREAIIDMRDSKARASIQQIGAQFMSAHPEYPVSDANERAMFKYIQTNNLAFTVANLEIAFEELSDAGLVTAASSSTATPVVPARTSTTSVTEVPRKRMVVGSSTRQSSADGIPDTTPNEVSVDDLLKLSPDARRRIVLQSMAKA
jgi:hypothetical protein